MEKTFFKDYEYVKVEDDTVNIAFFTAKGDLNFNINLEDGQKNIKMIKEEFKLQDIGYLRQIHSDEIYSYDGQIHEGDALITDIKGVGIGVFTADCVPIMMYDKNKGVIAAVHSGWKGTYTEITSKTIERMAVDYGSNPADIKVYIGPHNRECCYEIGEEVAEKFRQGANYDKSKILLNNKLSMEQCIISQCLEKGIPEKNIKSSEICTFCNSEYELYSYRKNNLSAGRLFSMIYFMD
jgi:polyphenol oxidase